MIMEASLGVKVPNNWVSAVGNKYPTPIKFIECMPYGDEGGRGFIEVDTEPGLVNDMIEDIRSHPSICRVDISNFGEGKFSGSVITNKCVACRALTGSECFLASARTIGDGWCEWKVISGGDGSLADLVKRLKDVGCEVEVRSITRLNDVSVITRRQEEVVSIALKSGYYDYPRRTTIRDLAKRMNVSPSTLGEILQRAEKNIVEAYFKRK
jgi:predicted DNA binding protein